MLAPLHSQGFLISPFGARATLHHPPSAYQGIMRGIANLLAELMQLWDVIVGYLAKRTSFNKKAVCLDAMIHSP